MEVVNIMRCNMSCLASFHRNKLSAFFFFQGPRVSSSSNRICPSKEKREKRKERHNVFWGENRIDIITAPCSLSRLLCCSMGSERRQWFVGLIHTEFYTHTHTAIRTVYRTPRRDGCGNNCKQFLARGFNHTNLPTRILLRNRSRRCWWYH